MTKAAYQREQISRIHEPVAIAILFVFVVFLAVSVGSPLAHAQTFKVLYTFTGGSTDEGSPPGLLRDAKGNFYSTTGRGGNDNCNCGEVFEVTKTGGTYKETALYSFGYPPDGEVPLAAVIRDSNNNLYGTTAGGGTIGGGTIFKLDTSGSETVLYSFSGGGDGGSPQSALLLDAQNNLYGTTYFGGDLKCNPPNGCGAVFKLDTLGKLTVLHRFTGLDGANPNGPLIQDAEGNFYGTTFAGGSGAQCPVIGQQTMGCGTVFKLDIAGKLTVLHKFKGFAGDGANPTAGLVLDSIGNLFGTTSTGGYLGCSTALFTGCGTVFKLNARGKETVLHRFINVNGDGAVPYAGVIRDANGNLFGTTATGGNNSSCISELSTGCGTIFELDTAGKETILYNFGPGPNSSLPFPQGLLLDRRGNLYGNTDGDGAGFGTVFEVRRSQSRSARQRKQHQSTRL